MSDPTLSVYSSVSYSSLPVAAAADRLLQADRNRRPCAPVRDLIGSDDIVAAYAVQRRLTEYRRSTGARVVGRKIGLTSPAVQAQLGVDSPDFGVLFDDMDVSAGPVPFERLLQPKVEAEVAFVLAEDLADGDFAPDRVRGAVAYAVAALEIVDSRVEGWDITLADTVADNASSGLYVLGDRRVGLDAFTPVEARMELEVDGSVVSTGDGTACLGDPLLALAWLARTLCELGDPLRAGQVVLSGALGPMVPVSSGAVVTARISGLGEVHATFSDGESLEGGPA